MPEGLVGSQTSTPKGTSLSKHIPKGTKLKKLIRIFRSNNVVKHHFQAGGHGKPQGTARAFFKNAYSFQSSVIPGYSAYDRFARYSDYAEMEAYPVLGNALNIFTDEVMQKNEEGKIIQVVSEDKDTQRLLQELYDNILHLNGKSGWKLVRNLIKYGDSFYLIDITEENGVVNLIHMPANEVEREEGFDKDDPTAIRFRWTAKQNIEIPNAYVAHFRLDGNDIFHPYGQSVLEAARRPWRQLVLLEDAMMVYRITRAPERRVFFLDIAGVPPEDIQQVVNKFNETLKKEKVVDEQGRLDLRYGSTMSMEEDYIIPVRGNETGTRIDTLPGGQNLGDIEDIEFIRANLFSALGIPKAFLTFDQDIKSKQVLTQEDIRFARTVSRVQEVVMAELVKIAMIHLYIKGKRGAELTNFSIKMTNPSTVAELQKMELWRARMDLVMAAKEGVFDTTFLYKNFLRLSDDAIEKIKKGQIQDKMFQAKLLQIENSQGMMQPGMGGMGMDMGMGGGMPMGGGMGGAPPEMAGAPAVPGAPGMAESKRDDEEVINEEELEELKDLTRDSSGDHRHAAKRGLVDLTGAGDIDDDPNDLAGIRRTITSPMGGRESFYPYPINEASLKKMDKIQEKIEKTMQDRLRQFMEVVESYDKKSCEPLRSYVPQGLSEKQLVKEFGEDVGVTDSTVLTEEGKITQKMLKEAVVERKKEVYELMEWELKLEKLDSSSNKIIKEVYNLSK